MNPPYRYSVAICTYNGAQFVKEQIASILNQTYPPDEIIISDDASKDGTVLIVQKMARENPIIRVLVQPSNLKLIKNFERCVTECTGDFIFLADQDDIWKPNKIETFDAEIRKRNISPDQMALLFSDMQVVDVNLNTINPSFWQFSKFKIPSDKLTKMKTLLVQNFVTGAASMVSRGLVQLATPFPEQITMHDYWFALVAAQYGQLVEIPEALGSYRQHGSNVVGAQAPTLTVKIKKVLSGDIPLFKKRELTQKRWNQIEELARLNMQLNGLVDREILKSIAKDFRKGGISAIRTALANETLPNSIFLKFLFFTDLVLEPYKK